MIGGVAWVHPMVTKATKKMLSILVSQKNNIWSHFLFVGSSSQNFFDALLLFVVLSAKRGWNVEMCCLRVTCRLTVGVGGLRLLRSHWSEIRGDWYACYVTTHIHVTYDNSETFLGITSSASYLDPPLSRDCHMVDARYIMILILKLKISTFIAEKFENVLCCNFLTSTIATWEVQSDLRGCVTENLPSKHP